MRNLGPIVDRRHVSIALILMYAAALAGCGRSSEPLATEPKDEAECRTVQPSPVAPLEQVAPGPATKIVEAARATRDRSRKVIVVDYEIGRADELLFLPENVDGLSGFTILTPSGEVVADGVPAGTVAEHHATGLEFEIPRPEAGAWSLEFGYADVDGRIDPGVLPGRVRVVEVSAALERPVAMLEVRGEGLEVTFDAGVSQDPDGEVMNVLTWSFGDGCYASGLQVQHTYDEAGTYLVAFEIQDDDGVEDFGFADITVGDGLPEMSSPSGPPPPSSDSIQS
jgi:hypothetical protein